MKPLLSRFVGNQHIAFVLAVTLIAGCFIQMFTQRSEFTYRETSEGIDVFENSKPVFHYQRTPKSTPGGIEFNNYVHPLYGLNGDTLTEEFPADHFHHRGIFWAWHQVFIGDKQVGDGWMMENITNRVGHVEVKTEKERATIMIHATWQATALKDSLPFIAEQTLITVFPEQQGIRKIDFVISLQALVPGVSLGGSDDEKGYGGFSIRLRMPDDLVFTSVNGRVTPQDFQVMAGPWMDFSGTFRASGEVSGVSLLCLRTDSDHMVPWILRQKGSMQNAVFPGRNRVVIPIDIPLVLRYRLILHKGRARDIDLNLLQAEYRKDK